MSDPIRDLAVKATLGHRHYAPRSDLISAHRARLILNDLAPDLAQVAANLADAAKALSNALARERGGGSPLPSSEYLPIEFAARDALAEYRALQERAKEPT